MNHPSMPAAALESVSIAPEKPAAAAVPVGAAVPSRSELVARIGRAAPTIIDNQIAAALNGDLKAGELLLKKILPDLKAVDVSSGGETFRIEIAPRLYVGGARAGGGEKFEMPSITVNIGAGVAGAGPVEEAIDVTPAVEEKVDYRAERKAGRCR